MERYQTIFVQAEEIDTDEAYKERDEIYKSMSFEEIINLINEINQISELIATNLHEFNLNTAEIGAIGNELKSMNKTGECLATIAQIRHIKGQ